MYVDSIIAINANPHHSPHTGQHDSTSNGKKSSAISFEEHLRNRLQQANVSATTSQAESQLAGLLLGYYSNLRMTSKTEPKSKENAS